MKKVNQKSINEFMGFADYIRSFLRQNPDTILVGEIRDNDTAEIAIKASTTGHLVLSSLHSRSAIGTISRLRNLGVPNDNISSNLLGSIGQRLIRNICESCSSETRLWICCGFKETYTPLRCFYIIARRSGNTMVYVGNYCVIMAVG